MPRDFLKKSLNLILRRQTNILSAAFIIMMTIVLSQILGLVRQRLLVGIFGASDTLGIYLASSRLPDFLFQITIAGALSSAFIPIFSQYLLKENKEDAYRLGSTLFVLGLTSFSVLSLILFIFANGFLALIAPGLSSSQITLMASLMKIIIVGELLFMVGSFLSVILQSYNHFFIPGIASALYNLGVIIGIIILHPFIGIFSAAYGVILGATIFVVIQLPKVKNIGFSFLPTLSLKTTGVLQVIRLMWPRTLSIAIFQTGTILTFTLISFLPAPGRNYVIFDYAQTLAFAPIVLFGQAIAQAAFPVLSREKNNIDEFKATFITSLNQILYLILPVSVLFLVLRIPIVRLVFGAAQFDWQATVLTGKTLAFFSISIFAQALINLVSRGFYALHDTKTTLYIGTFSTIFMLVLGFLFIRISHMGVDGIAIAYSIANITHLLVLFVCLDKKTGGFKRAHLILPISKIFIATVFTGFALYVPIKLLDQLVFDTTRTINLLLLTGISSFIGLTLYLLLTWLFNVKEAITFLLIFKKIGNWKEILAKSKEPIEGTTFNP